MSERLHFIDCARTYAVFLALLSHAFISTGVFAYLGDDSLYVKQFTRMALPMFVFMFGFMIEFVYVKKAKTSGLANVRNRLHIRAFQCYFAYCVVSLCAVLGGYRSFPQFVDSLIFLGDSRFGNILRVYAVIMIFAPMLVRLRLRYGGVFLVLALVCVFLSFPVLASLRAVDFGALNVPLNILFGIGPDEGGPSAWHSLSFVFAGMLMASSLEHDRLALFSRFYLYALGILLATAMLWLLFVDDDFVTAWESFADMRYREENMAGYFIIGTGTSVIALALFCLAVGVRRPPAAIRLFMPVGLSSLIAYTVGNILLNLFGKTVTLVGPAPFLILFFAAVLAITTYVERLPFYRPINGLLNLRFERFSRRI